MEVFVTRKVSLQRHKQRSKKNKNSDAKTRRQKGRKEIGEEGERRKGRKEIGEEGERRKGRKEIGEEGERRRGRKEIGEEGERRRGRKEIGVGVTPRTPRNRGHRGRRRGREGERERGREGERERGREGVDAIHFKVKDRGSIVTKSSYTAYGISLNGYREILEIWLGASQWLSMDGLKGLPEALSQVYPKTEVQVCVIHMIRASLKHIPNKHYKEFIVFIGPFRVS